jgi:hypothetical protein
MALLLILLALFGFVFAGFDSGSSHTSSPQRFEPRPGKTHVQKSVTRSSVTVHASARATSSVSCSARVSINGAAVQTSRRCRRLPVNP